MKTKLASTLIAATVALSLAGCTNPYGETSSNSRNSDILTGAGVGAAVGAGVGALSSSHSGRGALIGAGTGAAVGALGGAILSDD